MKIRPDLVGRTLAKTSAEATFLTVEALTSASGICGEVSIASFVVLGGGFFVALSNSSLNKRLVNVSIVAVWTFKKITVDDRDVKSSLTMSLREFVTRTERSSFEDGAPAKREKKVRSAGAWSLLRKLSNVEAPDRGDFHPRMFIQQPSICETSRIRHLIFIKPSPVLVSISRGMSTAELGAIFFVSVRML